MSKNKRSITLIEILIVMTLISITLGTIALHTPRAIRAEQFEQGVQKIKSKIMLAQELMISYKTDVFLTLTMENNACYCSMKANHDLYNGCIYMRKEKIRGIKSVTFNSSEKNTLTLCFNGNIGNSPTGKLSLQGIDGQEVIFTLKGFPSCLNRGNYEIQKTMSSYPKALLSIV